MSSIEQYQEPGRSLATPASSGRAIANRRLNSQLRAIRNQTLIRTAETMAEGQIAREKVIEVDNVTREAISGQIMLSKWAETLAGADPLLHDEISLFRDVARLGKAQVIADLVDSYSRDHRMR